MNASYFDKVNFVIDAWSVPCEAPWYIYVETMWPAALEAFITLASFGWDDVARGFWRPRGLNPRRSGKRKGKWAKRVPRFPEIGEEIGKRLPGADQVKGRKWGEFGKSLWRIDTVAQRALFWWLVVDVTIDFAFNWTSLLYETQWCKAAALGRFSYRNIGMFSVSGGVWWKAGFGTEDYEHAPPGWAFNSGSTGAVYATIAAALDFEPQPGFPPPTAYGIRITNSDTGGVFAESIGYPDDPTEPTSLTLLTALPPGTGFEVRHWHNAAWAKAGNGCVVGIEVG